MPHLGGVHCDVDEDSHPLVYDASSIGKECDVIPENLILQTMTCCTSICETYEMLLVVFMCWKHANLCFAVISRNTL